jgi:hypothetical protein
VYIMVELCRAAYWVRSAGIDERYDLRSLYYIFVPLRRSATSDQPDES